MRAVRSLVLPASLGLVAVPAAPQLPTRSVLTLDAVKRVASAAEADAQRRGATVVIAVVDDGGHLLMLERLDDTQVASVDVAIAKARTAAIFISSAIVLAVIAIRAVTIMGWRLALFGVVLPAVLILCVTLVCAIHPRLQGMLVTSTGLVLFIVTMLLLPRMRLNRLPMGPRLAPAI